MQPLQRVKSVQEFIEIDKDMGVDRTYMYYRNSSYHLHTDKQEIDLVHSPVWGQMLFLDGTLQSTTRDEIIYHIALVHPFISGLANKKNILILGGGEGATAREVLRNKKVETVTMVDYDRELVDMMKEHGQLWSRGAFENPRLNVLYDDAWNFMQKCMSYDGVIIDLTDPDLNRQKWMPLLEAVIRCVKPMKGGFVMNAGLYLPWNTEKLKEIKSMIVELCMANPEFKYYIYTTNIPSFNGEWTFIVVSHRQKFMMEPEFMTTIPKWIRRTMKMLDDDLIDASAITVPNCV